MENQHLIVRRTINMSAALTGITLLNFMCYFNPAEWNKVVLLQAPTDARFIIGNLLALFWAFGAILAFIWERLKQTEQIVIIQTEIEKEK
jgi:hypothetical protein